MVQTPAPPNSPTSTPPATTRRAPRTPSAARSLPARLLALAGAVVLFFGVASIIEPTDSPAHSIRETTGSRGSGGTSRMPATTQAGLLGTLIGAMYTVEIFSGDPDPLYTVYDQAGNLLIDRATKEEVYRIDPSLDVDSMLGPAVGMVDHAEF
jgi:hypothetical protein